MRSSGVPTSNTSPAKFQVRARGLDCRGGQRRGRARARLRHGLAAEETRHEHARNTMLTTGGGSGIGLALAEEFAKIGNKVIVAARSAEKLRAAENKGLMTIKADDGR